MIVVNANMAKATLSGAVPTHYETVLADEDASRVGGGSTRTWRIVRDGTIVDAALVQEFVAARHVIEPLDLLSRREREVLAATHGTRTVERRYRTRALRVKREPSISTRAAS